MPAKPLGGYAEFTRTVDSIRVGTRHRSDLGDLGELIESIRQHGLLQPITVTPDGLLVCGARRLAAIRRLEYRTVSVWVRTVSTPLGVLLAEQEENRHHKPLSTIEAAALYAELKAVYAAEAAVRQQRSRFGATSEPWPGGGALDSAAPSTGRTGTARSRAARMVSGRDSSTRFEQVLALQQLADAEDATPQLRERVQAELARIKAGAAVDPAVRRVHAHLDLAGLDDRIEAPDTTADERRRLIAAARRQRLRPADGTQGASRSGITPGKAAEPSRDIAAAGADDASAPAQFDAVWRGLDRWWTAFDPTTLGTMLTDVQWQSFTATLEGTNAFADEAAAARRQRPHPAVD